MAVLPRQQTGPALRALAALLAAACLSAPAFARESEIRQRVLLPITVNQVARGEFLAFLDNDDVLMRVSDLEAMGVKGFSGRRISAPEGELVSLASLAPQVEFALDAESVSLELTTDPRMLGKKTVNLKPGHPDRILYSTDTSAFMNYSVNWRNFSAFDAFAETGVSLHGNLLYASASRDIQGKFTRGLTSFTVDDRERMRRWVAGDGWAYGGTLGGSVLMGGVSVSRNFDLDPYYLRYPSLGLSGAVTTPSTADIYVNGAIVRREQLPPGQFDLNNLPIPAGRGSATVVIRDAFGGEHTLASPFYASSAVLGRGISEYTYNVGFVRRSAGGAEGDGYQSAPAFLGRHRLGVTDWLTPELRAEGRSGLASAGGGVAARFLVGEVDADFSWSRAQGVTGTAAALGYRYIGQPFNAGVFARIHSARYANLALSALEDRALTEGGAFAGLQLGRLSLTGQYELTKMRDTGRTERLSLSTSVPVTRDVNVFVSAGRSRRIAGGDYAWEGFAGLSYSLPGGGIASLSHERMADGTTVTAANVQRSLPLGTGYGYQVDAAGGSGADRGRGLFQYQGPYGRYEASYERISGQNVETLSASGGIVMVGGAFSLSRAVGQSFALVRVPDVPGVTGFSSNQPVGTTNSRGDLLVPDILPYYGNRISIADVDVPLDYSIGETEKIVAPPYRGGALIVFPVQRARAVTGLLRLRRSGADVIPAYGTLAFASLEGKLVDLPIGGNGEFFVENAAAGTHDAVIRYNGTNCHVRIVVPETKEQFSNLGTVTCEDRPR